jgi:DNA-binding transcriptional ArsR family regulator
VGTSNGLSSSAISVAKALTHPVRLRVLQRIADGGEVSPSALADELRIPLANIAYHVRYLNELGVLRLTRTVPVRGTVQHIYTAKDVDSVRRLLGVCSELVDPLPQRAEVHSA